METITVQDMQNYLRINIPGGDIVLITDLLESAIEDVKAYVNNDFINDEGVKEEPTKLKTIVMKIVAIEYENRTEDNKVLIDNELRKLAPYRRLPGL